jgi:hypothetical protein
MHNQLSFSPLIRDGVAWTGYLIHPLTLLALALLALAQTTYALAQVPGGDWAQLGGPGAAVKQIAAAQNADGRLEVLGIGMDDALWTISQGAPGGNWGGWAQLGGPGAAVKQIVVAQNADGRLEVLGIGMDDALWTISQGAPGSNWMVTPSGIKVTLTGSGRIQASIGRVVGIDIGDIDQTKPVRMELDFTPLRDRYTISAMDNIALDLGTNQATASLGTGGGSFNDPAMTMSLTLKLAHNNLLLNPYLDTLQARLSTQGGSPMNGQGFVTLTGNGTFFPLAIPATLTVSGRAVPHP